jgi:hypothetical protein
MVEEAVLFMHGLAATQSLADAVDSSEVAGGESPSIRAQERARARAREQES